MSHEPEQPEQRDPDRKPTSGAGAALPQAEQADDKEQAEGGEDQPDVGR